MKLEEALEKAIELLQKDLDDPGSVDIMDLNEAQALGIEALKRFRQNRNFKADIDLSPLPGEIKEMPNCEIPL